MQPHIHNVSIYYEDTDFSGLVYHANYLRYFERAREHFLGRAELVRMFEHDGAGFVVYKAELSFREGAKFGDELEVRTTVELASEYRAIFHQAMWRPEGRQAMVDGKIHLVCVDADNKLVRLPATVLERVRAM